MAQRLRLYDCRISRLPGAIGLCASDINGLAGYINSAERRLLTAKEASDEGWWGTWAEVAFNVTQASPYVTMPRSIARAEAFNLCNNPIDLNNQFYEYLRFGNGRLPKLFNNTCRDRLAAYTRNNAPGFVDITNPPQYILIVPENPNDSGIRILVQGRDSAGNTIYSLDGPNNVQGIYGTLAVPNSMILAPGTASPMPYSVITGYQKDITQGPVQIFQVDPTTGAQVLLHTMQPGETTGWYRRYYFNNLPFDCCTANGPVSGCPSTVTPGVVQVTAICKMENIPVAYDTDYLLLQNLEAITEECQAIRYGDIDTPSAKQMEARHHQKAIGLLNGELAHYQGMNDPAVSFAPFGSANLNRVNIKMI